MKAALKNINLNEINRNYSYTLLLIWNWGDCLAIIVWNLCMCNRNTANKKRTI